MNKIALSLLILLSLLLSGCFPTIFAGATRATVAAAKDRSIGDAVDDAKISAKIKADFIKDGFRALYTKIDVEVINGRVMYTGVVDSEEDIMKALEIAWNQEGVKEVLNELQTDKDSGKFNGTQYAKDSLITAQIKAKTMVNHDIKFVNYTIVTSNNIVYIFGIARSAEELETVASIASQIKGVEKVITHARVNGEHAELK